MDEKSNPIHFGQYLVTLGLASFLAWKYSGGQLNFYINERFFPLVLFAAIMLWLMAAVNLMYLLKPSESHTSQNKAWLPYGFGIIISSLPAIFALSGQSERLVSIAFMFIALCAFLLVQKRQGYSLAAAHPASILMLLLLALPVIIGVSAPAQPLSSSSLDNRGVSLTATFSSKEVSSQSFSVIEEDRTILDWIKLAGSARDTSAYTRQQANVIGFVYYDERLDDSQFMLSRFVVTCCAADAQAIGLPVETMQDIDLVDNTWVRVQGTLDKTNINGDTVPLIRAASVEIITAPEQPYLYP